MTSLASFPVEFFRLFEEASISEIRLDCSSEEEAVRFRNRLYYFKRIVAETPPEELPAHFLQTALILEEISIRMQTGDKANEVTLLIAKENEQDELAAALAKIL